MQSRNRDTDVENKLMDTKGGRRGWGELGDWNLDIYIQAGTLEWLPCPPPGDLPNPRVEPASLRSPALAGEFFTTGDTWEDRF